jgi:hypothetical protein
LSTVVATLRKQLLISDFGAQMLDKTFSGIPLEVMKRMLSQRDGKLTHQEYPAVLRSFALTLQFYSTKDTIMYAKLLILLYPTLQPYAVGIAA